MNNPVDPTRKTLALVMLFALLAPFAAILTYFLFHKTVVVIGVFLIVGLLYFPTKIIVGSLESKK